MNCTFRCLSIFCTDLDKSYHFYVSVLGAQPLRSELTRRWLRLGSIEINLVPNATAGSTGSFPEDAMMCMWLETENLAEFVSKLHAKGVEIVEDDGEQFVLLADPDGLLIEVWQRGDD